MTVAFRATALANAVRKQYGHPVFFANLDFSVTDEPGEKLTIPPSLPLHGVEDNLHLLPTSYHNVSSQNLEELRKFFREFIAMNLIPWMEKMTLDWSELVRAVGWVWHTLITLFSIRLVGSPHDYSLRPGASSGHRLPKWLRIHQASPSW
jgi:hypothetical protein